MTTVTDRFKAAYGYAPDGVWAAPGRVNLIGEHTDYNDGFVLPFALDRLVLCAAGGRSDGHVRVQSRQMPSDDVSIILDQLRPGVVESWTAYPLGVLWAFRSRGHRVDGLDLMLDGDVPLGAGLSSSAALECAVALAVDGLNSLGLNRTGLAAIARHAENEFVGAPTGVMDQMASLNARADHLMLIDTRTLHVQHVPFDLHTFDLALLVIDTRAPHHLVDGEYARRRQACEDAARHLGVAALRDVALDSIDKPAFQALPLEAKRRARHVVTENARVLAVVAALQEGRDPRSIGPYLTASHLSLRDDFTVTIPQLDAAVDAALTAGAHGARMTGGGFGGCVIALVDAASAAPVTAAVEASFDEHGFIPPHTFHARPAAGARKIQTID